MKDILLISHLVTSAILVVALILLGVRGESSMLIAVIAVLNVISALPLYLKLKNK